MYVPLDVNFPDDDKVIETPLAAIGLYCMMLCLSKRLLSDGVLTRAQVARLGDREEALDALNDLIRAGLVVAEDAGDAVRIPAWLSHNAASEDVMDSAKGGMLAHRRWHVARGVMKDGCPFCEDIKAQVNADGCAPHMPDDADASETACGPHMPETEVETETDPERESSNLRTTPVARAKQACVVIARRQTDAIVAGGKQITDLDAYARTIAVTLWPTYESALLAAAEANPEWTVEQIASSKPITAIDLADAQRRERQAEEPPFNEAAAIAPDAIAAAKAALRTPLAVVPELVTSAGEA